MTVVDRHDVLAAARLARLRLEPAELDRLTADLEAILDHMAALREADVAGAPPFPGFAEGAPPRADEPAADPLAAPPGSVAPAWRDGFYVVPRLETHAGGEDAREQE